MKKKKKSGHDESADLRKRAEETLREREEEYRNLIERANDGIVIVQDGKVKYINARLAEMRGVTVEEVIGTPFTDHIYPDELPEVVDRYKQRMAGEDVSPIYETALRRRDGSKMHAELNAGMVTYQGKPADLVIIRDITERKRTEEALQVNLEKYRVLFESFPLGITISDKSGQIIEANRQSEQLLGITADVHVQRRVDSKEWQIIRKDGTPMPADEYASTRALRENRLIENVEMGIVKDKGEITWISVTAAPIPLEGYGVAIAYGDITERKRTEEALRESEARLQSLFETMAEGMILIAPDGHIVLANPAAARVLGLKRSEIEGRNYVGPEWEILRPDGTRMPPEEMAGPRAMKEMRLVKDVVMGVKRPDGTLVWINVSAAQLMDEDGRPLGVVGTFEDITERKQGEEKIQSLAKFLAENPDPILRIARDGTLLYINQAGLNLLPGWHLQVGKATPLMLREAVLQVMGNGSTRMLDIEHRRQIYSFSVAPVIDAGYANLYARDITERRKAREALRKSESQLRALSLELSFIEERERKRLASYLHDEIGQSLALLRMKFGSLTGIWGSKSRKQNIQQIRDLLEEVIDQTHTLMFELSPPVLHQLGLEAAIEWAGEKISQDFGIEFMFSDDGMIKPLSADIKALLFRCVRELMSNTVKHAKAKRITVSLTRREERVFVVVEDDGVGFDISLFGRPTEKVGFGLFSVRERLGAVGGSYEFQSEPGRGTRITLSVPLKEEMPSS
jgi:PAS domain S-box-containing protein